MTEDTEGVGETRRGVLADLRVDFARFQGSVSTELKNVSHDVKGLVMKLDAYATTKDLAATDSKVSKLEEDQRWLARKVIGAVLAAVLALAMAGAGVALKTGIHP